MSLLPVTERIISKVEQDSGVPVIVQVDPAMTLLAAIKIARGSSPALLLTYNPRMDGSVDYAICYQCGFLLRSLSVPQPERFDFVGSWRGRKETEKLLVEHGKQNRGLFSDRDMRDRVRDQLFDGLMRQLRSIPVGLRVDAWIAQDVPELKDQQRAAVHRQLNDNAMSLKPEVRRIAPERILFANVGMSAAFAFFWKRRFAEGLIWQSA